MMLVAPRSGLVPPAGTRLEPRYHKHDSESTRGVDCSAAGRAQGPHARTAGGVLATRSRATQKTSTWSPMTRWTSTQVGTRRSTAWTCRSTTLDSSEASASSAARSLDRRDLLPKPAQWLWGPVRHQLRLAGAGSLFSYLPHGYHHIHHPLSSSIFTVRYGGVPPMHEGSSSRRGGCAERGPRAHESEGAGAQLLPRTMRLNPL